jgi:hypothetical protein
MNIMIIYHHRNKPPQASTSLATRGISSPAPCPGKRLRLTRQPWWYQERRSTATSICRLFYSAPSRLELSSAAPTNNTARRTSTTDQLWDVAFRQLQETDSEIADLLQKSQASTHENVTSLIKYIEGRKTSFEDRAWNISCPRGEGKKPLVLNVRQVVYKIMEAALEFKDVIDNVLAFDATKYGT